MRGVVGQLLDALVDLADERAWLCAPFWAWESFIVTFPSFDCEAFASPKKRL